MKIKKYLFFAAALFTVSAASAQTTEVAKGWNSVYVQYDNVGTSYTKTTSDIVNQILDKSGNGFSVGYNHAFGLSSKLPLYVEVGAAVQHFGWSKDFHDEDGYTDTYKLNMTSLKVPVSLLYHFDVANSGFAIEPFAGIDFRYNLGGKLNYSYSNSEDPDDNGSSDYKFFKDQTDEDGDQVWKAWKRFQMGWHVGVNFAYKQVFLGVSYGQDFNKICEKIYDEKVNLKYNTLAVSLGYRF